MAHMQLCGLGADRYTGAILLLFVDAGTHASSVMPSARLLNLISPPVAQTRSLMPVIP